MMRRLFLTSCSVILVGLALMATAPRQGASPDKSTEAARLNNLGVAYMNQQLFEKGVKAFQDAAALDPKLEIAKLNQGIALLNHTHIEPAKQVLEEAVKRDPNDPHAWFNLGLLYKNSDNPQGAIDAFRHVTEIDPNDADSWYFLGAAYAQMKQYPQAIDAFQHALKVNPLHASAEFGLARVYQQSGDAARARENLQKFQHITQAKLGSPIGLAYGDQGKDSLVEESPAVTLKVPPQIPVKFVEVTKEAGLGTKVAPPIRNDAASSLGPGACFLDYDNDGKIDVFLPDSGTQGGMSLYHNVGNGRFEDVTKQAGLDPVAHAIACTVGDYDNDGFADLAVSSCGRVGLLHNERNGTFKDVTEATGIKSGHSNLGLTFVDYDHDGDLDLYLTNVLHDEDSRMIEGDETQSTAMWRNNADGTFTNVTAQLGLDSRIDGVAAIGTDYNNDRAVDLIVGQAIFPPKIYENPREGKFLQLELWPKDAGIAVGLAVSDFNHDGWMDLALTQLQGLLFPAVTLWRNNHGKSFESVPLPPTKWSRAYGLAAFDYDNDGATDLLITQNHGPAVLLKNEGGNKNNWLRLALKGLADNKSAIGTKVEVFSDGIRQKFEIYGSNGYLGQNSPYLTVGLGRAKQADVVRMLWPTGVLQDEVEVPANREQAYTEIDRRGSSCPTLFVWDGTHYELVSDMLGAGVVGHWVGPGQRNIPRPTEYVKVDRNVIQKKDGKLSFRLMEPMEEVVYLDRVRLLAVDHPSDFDVYPNEYFASNPPYPPFKVIASHNPHPPAGAWDEHGHNVLPDLLAHRYFGDFELLPFKGFTKLHSLELDLGEPYRGGPLRLLMHGEIEYFTATGMYAASQAGIEATAPYVEAEVPDMNLSDKNVRPTRAGKWVRVTDDMGFPAGLPRI